MRFEARNLKPHAEPVEPEDLREGEVYFFLHFEDADLLVPSLEPVVFIGRDLKRDDAGCVYFQDVASYRRGSRFPEDSGARYYTGAAAELGHVFEFEKALDALLGCSLRRLGQCS
jgi:hypothetical protein